MILFYKIVYKHWLSVEYVAPTATYFNVTPRYFWEVFIKLNSLN